MDEQNLGLGSLQQLQGMGFNLSPMALLGGFIFGTVGYYYFHQGRKRHYRRTMWVGVALMAYPLVVSHTVLIWCVGVFLWALAHYYRQDGQ